jgi:hypothetical protein
VWDRLAFQNRRDPGVQAQRERIHVDQIQLAESIRRQAAEREQAASRAQDWEEEERNRVEGVRQAVEGDFAAQQAAFRPYFHGIRDCDSIGGDNGRASSINQRGNRRRAGA